jgi:hypothetical protein
MHAFLLPQCIPLLCVAWWIENEHSLVLLTVDAGVDDLVCTHAEPEVLQCSLQRLLVDAEIASAHARIYLHFIRDGRGK